MMYFVVIAMALGFVYSADDRVIALESTVKAMQEQMTEQVKTIRTLTAALEAKATDDKQVKQHVQLMTGGEVVELVSAADVKAGGSGQRSREQRSQRWNDGDEHHSSKARAARTCGALRG